MGVRLARAALLALAAVAGCSPAAVLNGTISTAGLVVTRDVAYAPGPRHGLDVYRPERTTAGTGLPLVVYLYGGGWRGGDKGDYPFIAATLARRGAVVMVADYRLYPEVQFPAFVQDSAQAVAWAIGHAAEYGANPRDVFVMGHSAGAYNAAMLALDPRWMADAGSSRAVLAGVIGLAGPYDFLPTHDPAFIPVFGGANGPAAQPVNYVDGHNPPMLLLNGAADDTVRPRNAEVLAARVAAAGGPAEAKLYPGVGHIDIVLGFAPLTRGKAPEVLDDVWRFIVGHPGTG